MHKFVGTEIVCLTAMLFACECIAVPIEGEVSAVKGDRLTISSDSRLLPAVGDGLEVFIEIDRVGQARIATASVTRVDGDAIYAQIDKSTGQVRAGHLVRIESPQPVARAPIKVPILIGRDAPSVKKALAEAGLKVQFQLGVAAPAGVAPYTVYVQNPKANSSLPSGGKVVVTIYAASEAGAEKLDDGQLAKILAEESAKQPTDVDSTADFDRTDTASTTQLESALKGPSAAARQTVKAVTQLLPKWHVSGHPMDDEIARRMLTLLLDQLDSGRYYFTSADVASFRRDQNKLDDELRNGDLSSVYDMVRLYMRRVVQRNQLVEKLLAADHDFTLDEQISVNRTAENFPSSDDQIQDLWRKRVKHQLLVHFSAGVDEEEARRLATQYFHRYLENASRWTDADLLQFALSALANAYDPQSTYISQETYNNFVIQQRMQLEGIGAAQQSIDGYVEITKVIPGGPAHRDGRLKAGDRVLAVGQGEDGELVDIFGMRLNDVVKLIRGKKGTTVRLRVLSKGEFESKVYSIRRDKVELSTSGSAVFAGDQIPSDRTGKIGYIYLPSFHGGFAGDEAAEEVSSASGEVAAYLEDFDSFEVDAVILDLRANGGGTLAEVINTADLFLNLGSIVRGQNAEGRISSYDAKDGQTWQKPLVVVTSRGTSSGAENFAAAIQDHHRGLIVGDQQTHGSGTVQNVNAIGRAVLGGENPPELGFLKVTYGRLYRPSGPSTQQIGVKPDIILPSNTSTWGLHKDQKFAIQSDAIDPAMGESSPTRLDAKSLAELIDRSRRRREDSAFFQQLKANQRESASVQAISLNQKKFNASLRKSSKESSIPSLPGIPEVRLDGYLQEVMSITLDYVSQSYVQAGDEDYRAQRYSRAVERYQKAVAANPQFATGHYKLSWALATCRRKRVRDGKMAVEHARRACELVGFKNWHYLLALAVAEAEAGDFEQAQQHLQTALDRAPDGQREKYSFLERKFENHKPYRNR